MCLVVSHGRSSCCERTRLIFPCVIQALATSTPQSGVEDSEEGLEPVVQPTLDPSAPLDGSSNPLSVPTPGAEASAPALALPAAPAPAPAGEQHPNLAVRNLCAPFSEAKVSIHDSDAPRVRRFCRQRQ